MISSSILSTLSAIRPMLIIVTVVIFSIRIPQVILNNSKFNLFEESIIYLFIIYILILFNIVLLQDNNHYATSNFTLFKEISRYDLGSNLFYKNVIGNIIIFIPYTMFVSHFIKAKSIYLPVFLSFILSLTIELTQLFIAGRVFDIDDILLNVIGGVIGYIFYKIISTILSKFGSKNSKNLITIIVIILCVISILYIFKFF